MDKKNRYEQVILQIFRRYYSPGKTEFEFKREEIEEIAKKLGIKTPKNLGDIIYSFRYRNPLPDEILQTAKEDHEWIIEPAGRSKYRFKHSKVNHIIPRNDLLAIKIPDATPEIIVANALNDEQALLAKIRYNRLIDIFLGITTYSLQNHLRTTTKEIGQLEIDEVYVGVDKKGVQFIIPVQAKGGSDRLGVIQTKQDIACCIEKFPNLICRSVSTQFMDNNRIAMFELNLDNEQIVVVEEKHYVLVPSSEISEQDLKVYARSI